MLSLRVDKLMRIASGLGLLLLLAAQEKVCPWLVTPESDPEQSTPATLPPSDSGTDQDGERRRKTILPHVLPDAPAPRWPAAWGRSALRETIGARDGIVSCGEPNPSVKGGSPATAAADPCAWHRFLQPAEPAGVVEPVTDRLPAVDPALRTCIFRRGPPRG